MMIFGTYLPVAFLCVVPDYFSKPKITKLDQAIQLLPEEDKLLLIYRYIASASFDDIGFYCKMTIKEVGDNLSDIEDYLSGKIK